MKPFIKTVSNMVLLYSGNEKDAIPFLAFRVSESKVYAQIPGGGNLEINSETAIALGQAIVNLGLIGLLENQEALWQLIKNRDELLASHGLGPNVD